MNQNQPNMFQRLWGSFIAILKGMFTKENIIQLLKDKFIKASLKKVLGSSAAGGIKGWLVTYAATELYEEIAEPIMKYLWRKGNLYYDKQSGELKYKKIIKAKEGEDEATYISTIGSV